MAHPVIGWERTTPAPNHVFNAFLSARNGHLHLEDLDLAEIVLNGQAVPGLNRAMPSPLEIVYLPLIGRKIAALRQAFAEVIAETGYPGKFHYAYASKANVAQEVVQTALTAGTHYEMSAQVDVEIARRMIRLGYLRPPQMIIANGFKISSLPYAADLLTLKTEYPNLIPVVEDLAELPALIQSGLPFEVGLRQKSYGHYQTVDEMDRQNSRFGLALADLFAASDIIAAAPNLSLKLYHAMIGSQITDQADFVRRLTPALTVYAQLKQKFPTLSIFDFGGGLPAGLTLDFQFDYHAFARLLLTTIQSVCAQYGVAAPDVMGEFGRYTTAEHGAHLFKVLTVKDNGSAYPWYIINGSIMTSFPDSWALSEHFIVLPLNHLDGSFRRVQLGGVTCDSDDVYPPKPSQSALYLPVETTNLYLGFFSIGAYQEMLGGVRGSKHCALPEAGELIVDREAGGAYRFRLMTGQTITEVLQNLGYPPEEAVSR